MPAIFSDGYSNSVTTERSLLWGIQFIWYEHIVISAVNPFVWEEVAFGGFRVTLTLTPSFYGTLGSCWTLPDTTASMTVAFPGGGDAGDFGVFRGTGWYNPHVLPVLGFVCASNDNHMSLIRLPEFPIDAWQRVTRPGVPSVFYDPP